MGIETEYQAYAMCDECGDSYTEAFWTQRELIKDLRRQGWSIGKKVLCPECRQKKVIKEGR